MPQDYQFLAAASDFYGTLAAIDSTRRNVRQRYAALAEVLELMANQSLKDVNGATFTGLFSKLDYLYKAHCGAHADNSLWLALNKARVHTKDAGKSETAEYELVKAWPHEVKAVCLFIELVYGTPPPDALAARFPQTEYHHYRKRVKDGAGDTVGWIKCSLVSWDEQAMRVTREDTGEDATVRYCGADGEEPDRSYLRPLLSVGVQLGLVAPREENGEIYPELVILHPDTLVNVTSVAYCFTDCGVTPYAHLLKKIEPQKPQPSFLLGNFAGQLLDEATYGRKTTYAESLRKFFRRNALAFVTCPDGLGKDFHSAAQAQRENIRHIMDTVYPQVVKDHFRSDEVILEPSFVAPQLGLQGRMDFLDLNYRVLIEQKSGKGEFRPGLNKDDFGGAKSQHKVQTQLYRALLHYGYRHTTYREMVSLLLYSRYADGLGTVPSMPSLTNEAFRVRNQIAWLEHLFAEKGFGLLDKLTPERIYTKQVGKLWENFVRPQTEQLLAPLHSASPLERAYYHRLMRFVAAEQQLSQVGNREKENSGFAAIWCSTPEEKRRAGNLCDDLRLVPVEPEEEGGEVTDVRLLLPEGGDTSGSNFRAGDIVMCYPYRPGSLPDATATMVLRCTLTEITAGWLTLRLRNPQTSHQVFEHFAHSLWAVEHDFMESSYSSLYRGLHAFLSAPKLRRDLLLGQRTPAVDTSRRLAGDYGGEYFDQLVLRAKQAEDFYLVIGPPGTGKTSYGLVNILREELLSNNGGSVLLLSYTNRAVDEICGKLSEMRDTDGSPLPYIRIGTDYGCAAPYRPHLLSELAAPLAKLSDINALIEGTRVFCATTTTLSANIALLGIKNFSLAIIDEASQILEPHLLGLLSATDAQGECAIRKFVLIGDEKQLPAVVQQPASLSRVDEPELHAIGLTDCRLSLFERLLRVYGHTTEGKPRPEVCHQLTRQGRMHPDIAAFPNEAFYQNTLCAVPLPHQLEETPAEGDRTNSLSDMLATHRVAFIDCPPRHGETGGDKVNTAEADVIAAVVAAARHAMGESFDPQSSIGVIVPYRNQIAAVRCAVERTAPPGTADISIDTVERYQGSQRDVIVYGFTASKYYQLSFLTGNEYTDSRDGAVIDRKLNVAMTRARRRLVLTGNASLLSHGNTFHRLLSYLRRKGCFFRAADVLSPDAKLLPPAPHNASAENATGSAADKSETGTAELMPPALSAAFEKVVEEPLRRDRRSRHSGMPLGNAHDTNLQLLSYGRCDFSRPLALFAAPETGERLTFTPHDQAMLYAHYAFPAHYHESRELYAAHAREADGLLRGTCGRLCMVDIGCGPSPCALAATDVWGGAVRELHYWGIDPSRIARTLAERMAKNFLPDGDGRWRSDIPKPGGGLWENLSARPALVVFHISGLFGCVSPRRTEKLTQIISGVMRRYIDNRYVLAVCQSESDAQLAPAQVMARWAAENNVTLWQRDWTDDACPLS